MQMWLYIVRRVILLFPVILGVMTITFACISALPVVDRMDSAFGPPPTRYPPGYQPTYNCSYFHIDKPGQCPNPMYDKYAHLLGLDMPVWAQWGTYMVRTLTFQWGYVDNYSAAAGQFEFMKGQTVITALGELLPYTLELAAVALLIVLAVSIPLGTLSAVNRNRPIDQISRVVSFSGYALPAFLLGGFVSTGVVILLMGHFGHTMTTPWCPRGEAPYLEVNYSWPTANICYTGTLSLQGFPLWVGNGVTSTPTGFPTVDAFVHHDYWLGLDTLIRMVLPALVIAYGSIAGLLRFVRNSMLEVMNLDYVRTARAKGVSEKVVVSRHAGRNSLNVTITILGLTFAGFIGGFPIIETVFNLWGVGRLLALAIQFPLDYGLIFGSTILFTFIVVFANLIVDICYAYLDPRVRLG